MAEYPNLKDEDIPAFVRRCWERYMDCTEDERAAEKTSQGFYIGGKLQWREIEIQRREASNRPWVSINRCKPAVDQIENEARNNPPGPQAHPIGGSGSDDDAALSLHVVDKSSLRVPLGRHQHQDRSHREQD